MMHILGAKITGGCRFVVTFQFWKKFLSRTCLPLGPGRSFLLLNSLTEFNTLEFVNYWSASFWNQNKKHDFLNSQTNLVYFPSLFKDIQLSSIHADFVFSLWFCKESSDIFQFLWFSFPFRILFFQMLSVQCSSSSTLCM